MAVCTRRDLLLLGTHSFVLQSLHAVFVALFMEYYMHGFLLVDTCNGKKAGLADTCRWRVHISKTGLCVLIAAQLVYTVCNVLDEADMVSFSSVVARAWRRIPRHRLASNEVRFAIAFGLSWCVLRLPLVPSAVSFTLATAIVGVLSDRCVFFAQNVAREVATQRPREENVVLLASRGAAVVVLVAALLYDGSYPKRKSLHKFHWYLLGLCGVAVGIFSGPQRWRCNSHGEEAASAAREECSLSMRSFSGFGDATMDFRGFARQTWQRRSMKALLVVRALHCYAHAGVVGFFHLLLTLACAPRLSAAVRAVILAFVVAAPSFLAPVHVAVAGLVGKKRLVLVMLLGVCALGFVSLVAAFFTRGALAVTVSPTRGEGSTVARSGASVWLCAVLLTLLRLLLDSVRDVLELAQEDVIEEDSILFARATPMVAWTRRLCDLAKVPMESFSRIAGVLLLAFTNAFQGVVLVPPVASGNGTTSQTTTAINNTSAALALEKTLLLPDSPAEVATTNMTSAVLAFLSLHTCGVALAMLVVWYRYYNLEGKHLLFVQMATRKRKDQQCVALV
ncbi:hypothetical protein, conserved [Leishmania tarentolae]|uniref:Transmembrane protein n=1 Tax=Leishmania tarentolae TaxID=5689 RepID=A0A640KLA4_LEITA|nr:hypothetical protein, conserved [Leishmania tarentolae]